MALPSYVWRVGLLCLIAACGDSHVTDPLQNLPARLDVIAGDGQSAAVGTEVPEALVVRVLNAAGQPIANQIINFRVVDGGGNVFAGATLTNVDGLAKERWTLGTSVADSQIVEARAVDPASGAPLVFGRFIATALPGAPAMVQKIRGDNQTAIAGSRLPDSLVVRVRDLYGNAVPSAAITWSIEPGAGAVAGASAATDGEGFASAAWTLGNLVGPQSARAIAGDGLGVFSATANAEPIAIAKVEGDDQAAAPGNAVRVPPAVRATDNAGNARAGVMIRFAVVAGNGSITGGDAVSDAEGVARVGSWILGVPGSNSLSATSPSGSTVTFNATATQSPVSLTLTKWEGDAQTAVPGSVLPVPPAVRVTNAQGPVGGVTVTFSIGGGGGGVTGATAVSDGLGIARVGSWQVGSTTGVNALVATAVDAPSVTFTATAAQTSPDISISLTAPAAGLVGDFVSVSASITSTYQVASVTARIGNQSSALTVTQPGRWEGAISLVDAPRDTTTLVVRATDINNSVAEVVRVLTHDRPPRVVVTAPLNGAVARPMIQLDAACDDDDSEGCTLVVLRDGAVIVGPTPSPLQATVSLGSSEGGSTVLSIRATDSRNQVTAEARTVWVEPSPALQLIGSAEGMALDVRGSRLLLLRETEGAIVIHHLGGGQVESWPMSGTVQRAYLTSRGAVLSIWGTSSPRPTLHLWRDGFLTTRVLNSTTSLAAAGDHAIYTVPPNGFGPLYRVNTSTGAEERLAEATGNTENDVAENGDVAYWVPYNILRYRSSGTTQVTNDDGSVRRNTYPLTDGTNVVFRRHPPCCTSPWPMEIWHYDGASLTMLAAHASEVTPREDYAVSGGWTAFTKPDASGFRQVWTRSPAGALRAVSAFGSSSRIDAIAPDGSVVFVNGSNRYIVSASGTPARVSSSLGVVRWRDGRFVALIGNSAFAIAP